MTPKWDKLNAGQNEKPTTDGESLPALPVEAESVIEQSNNPYALLLDKDSPQADETIEVKPEKQLEKPRENLSLQRKQSPLQEMSFKKVPMLTQPSKHIRCPCLHQDNQHLQLRTRK